MIRAFRINNLSYLGQLIFFFTKYSSLIYLIISLMLFVFARSSRDFNFRTQDIILTILTPVSYIVRMPANFLSSTSSYIKESSLVKLQNKKLLSENQELRAKLLSMSYFAAENQELKASLNLKETKLTNAINAKIYINNASPFSRLAVINAGLSDDIQKGQILVTNQGLVGRILRVAEKHSYVLLIGDYSSRVPVYTATSRERAIMFGHNDRYPKLRYFRKDHKIQSGEIIYTSGDGLVYPENIPVGIVSVKKSNQIRVIPFANLNKISIVSIIPIDKSNEILDSEKRI